MKKHVTNLAGSNLYLDIYGNTVYYNVFDKNGYIVTKEVEQKFRLLYYRYSIIVIVFILLGDYFKSLQNTLMVGIGAVVLVEVYFRAIYLKKLKVIKNFKRDKKVSKLELMVRSEEKEKTVMKACAYILLSALIVINAIQQNFNIMFMILSGIVAIYSIYSGVLNIVAVSKMKKVKI
ncbi:Uncharacterised protein [uncultured Clostridium sp.]|uniref:hypothetical protein n=1 Tax=uncultured Clostridium sp. TaxID=59620 RepID=UPI000823152E|nr:hypothetical protein [uncultured Clostridium sp.]SCI75896.1 Uncharacterised protein [uncultured Clostridium sp.]